MFNVYFVKKWWCQVAIPVPLMPKQRRYFLLRHVWRALALITDCPSGADCLMQSTRSENREGHKSLERTHCWAQVILSVIGGVVTEPCCRLLWFRFPLVWLTTLTITHPFTLTLLMLLATTLHSVNYFFVNLNKQHFTINCCVWAVFLMA